MTTFWATVAQVRTMADGGLRVWLDLPENAILQAAELMAYKQHGVVLNVECTPKQDDDKTEKRPRKIHI